MTLSPPSRKRRLALDRGEITTRPTSPSKHGMCLRSSRKSPLIQEHALKSPLIQEHALKSPLIQEHALKSPLIQEHALKSPLIQELTPPSLKNETQKPFKTPRKPLLIPRISRKRVRLEFKEPDPATITSLSDLFDYDDFVTRKPRIPKFPRLPSTSPTSSDELPQELHYLICEDNFL